MRLLPLALFAMLFGCATSLAATAPVRFRFELDNDYSTSAGVFDSQGTLIRTLWSNRRYRAGAAEETWDGRDDDGHLPSPDEQYEIRVLTHNVIYTWDGVIGNSSDDQTSPSRHDAPQFLNDLQVAGDRAYFTVPEEGATPTMRFFRLDAPQSWQRRPAIPLSYGANMGLIAADSERVYWAHDASPWKHLSSAGGGRAFVIATDRDLTREIPFDAGQSLCLQQVGQGCYRDGESDFRVSSAIDVVAEVREDPATAAIEAARNNVTGIAVQQGGSLLFVAHGRLDQARIHVLDKRTGKLLAQIPLRGVGRLVAVPGSNDLWAIHDADADRVVSRLRVGAAPDFRAAIVRTLRGFEAPIGLALSPDGRDIVVADAGASQQLRAFDAASGEPVWQLGAKGGYAANGPEVSTDRFSFRRHDLNARNGGWFDQTILSFAPDGSFWVGDTGLSRLLRFGADRRYVDQISFTPMNYNVAVDRANPSRVFSAYREYAVDYAQPIAHSWRLVRYFGDAPGLEGAYHGYAAGFLDVATLRNGRTYGLLRALDETVVVEIPAHGDLERLPLRLQQGVFMTKEGDLYGARDAAAARVEVWRRPLEGFDAGGAPSWGHEEVLARVPHGARDPRVAARPGALERPVAELAPDLHIVFDPANSDPPGDAARAPFHLGAIRNGASRWSWRASPASGPFNLSEPDGVFDSSRPWYAGMAVSALGEQIVYNYHGEGWHNASQANQFLHWSGEGLFIGQFGIPDERAIPPATPGMAGNSFSIQLVDAAGATWLWHNDENAHAGLHRWRLDGVEWIRELTGRARPGESLTLTRAHADKSRAHENDAPASLVARAIGQSVRLAWKNVAKDARGVEVQRLQPTYVGPRFEQLATLPADATSFVDSTALAGEPTVYRVRALFAAGSSDYSNHVHVTALANSVVLESQSFETPPPGLRDDFHLQGSPDVRVEIIPDPDDAGNKVLHVLARKPLGQGPLQAQIRWTASRELFDALNTSVARPRDSRPDFYRIRLRLRVAQAHLAPGSSAGLEVDPGYHIFSATGRLRSLPALAASQGFDFAAIPNGTGLQQFRAFAPTSAAVVFPISLQSDGDVIEFFIDDLSVARLDPSEGRG